MRYTLYSQMKDILKTVIEALEYIQENKNLEMASQLLSDGNNAIQHISQKIIENESSVTSREVFNLSSILLERIPTALHKIEYLSSLDDIEFVTNATKEFLHEIDANVHYKFEIVFFAELGQKWGAMNSLYQAFNDREDCDVTVVLTPILRQVQSEGSVKEEIIYEDYLTDLGIDYIPYEKYDLSLDPPDMALISNPYESVTIPQFWPENIAQYTRLVYIPYYTKNSLNDTLMITESKLPFINEAWNILVQSEETKKAYQKYGSSKKDNYLIADLPKWDELAEIIKKDNFNVPEWGKLNGKTVFLWNIHYSIDSPVSTFLENGREIVRIFEENRDIALIFRPHPMTETIFKLYKPEHRKSWEKIKKVIQESNNMVIDSNSSYKNAFAYSDALLSEHSSILSEYAFLKKPVLWLKKEETDHFFKDANFMEHLKKLRQAYTTEQIKEFIESVAKDPVIERDYINLITQDLSVLDGRNGERIARSLLTQFQQEIR